MPAPRGVVPGAPSVESRFQPATDVEYYLYPSRQDRKAGWPLTVTTPGLIFPTVHIQYAAIGPVRQNAEAGLPGLAEAERRRAAAAAGHTRD